MSYQPGQPPTPSFRVELPEGGVGGETELYQAKFYVGGTENVPVELADKTILLGCLFALLGLTRIFS